MLSISTIKSSSGASKYFEKDNYYLKVVPGAEEQNFWHGKTAKSLNLTGAIKPEAFQNILEGYLPNGERLGIEREGKWQHRPGWDLTFSAPKSVSIAALVGNDERLVQAHNKSVRTVLDQIEKECSQARIFVNGKTEYQDTGNLLAALFTHNVSRELDPALHTHCAIANVTQRLDGKFRSLASKAGQQDSLSIEGFGERVCSRMKYYGSLYRAQLAYEVTQLGYEIESRKDLNGFEIKGIPESLQQVFSKRREQILEKVNELGRYDAKTNEYATLITRAKKQQVDQETLLATWQLEAKEHQFDAINFVKEQRNNTQQTNTTSKQTQQKLSYTAVHYARQHLSEREAIFSKDELAITAMYHCVGQVSPESIQTAINQAVNSGELIPRTLEDRGKLVQGWTTKEAVKIEKDLINELHISKFNQHKSSTLGEVQYFLQDSGLTPGQLSACQLILISNEKIIGVQGFAGTGKTTLLNCVREFHAQNTKHNITIRGVAPQGSAANQLRSGAGIPSQTLYSFLNEQDNAQATTVLDHKTGRYYEQTEYKNNLIIVDESSMISNRDMLKLLKYANERKFKVVLMGDEAQLGAIEAGKPFSVLQRNGMSTAVMQDIVRQNNTTLKAAVHDVIAKDVTAAFDKLEKNIIECPNETQRFESIVSAYLNLNKQDRASTMVLTAANKDREHLNNMIRDGLVAKGDLGRKSYSLTTLHNRGLTRVEQKKVSNYFSNDQVRFNREYPNIGIKPGNYYTIVTIDKQENMIILSDHNGKQINWNPAKIAGGKLGAIEVYEPKSRQISKHESIRWTRNNKYQQQTNAEMATIVNVKSNKVTARLQNGELLKFDPRQSKNQHFEYAYANTAHFSQGQTCKQIFALSDTKHKRLTSLRSFYVLISRAKENAVIYTDNKQELARQLKNNTGEKTSSLEGIIKPEPAISEEKVVIKTQAFSKLDPKVVLEQLNHNTEYLAESLLGQPNPRLSNSRELRFGKKGSLVVTLTGHNRGLWISHEDGKGGNLLQLIQRECVCGFSQALEYAAQFSGVAHEKTQHKIKSSENLNIDQVVTKDTITQEDQRKIAYAKSIYAKSKPIAGTIAENYLRTHRGINIPLSDNLRFLPTLKDHISGKSYPALLAVARNNKGELEAVQVTYLDPNTTNKASIDANKRTFGRMKFGASVTLQQGSISNNLMLAEGVETALSIAEAFPDCTVKASLSSSNFSKIYSKENNAKTTILCADNDGDSPRLTQVISNVVSQAFNRGSEIFVSVPTIHKSDFNDLHRVSGIEAVRSTINSYINQMNKHYRIKDQAMEFTSNAQVNISKSKLAHEFLTTMNKLQEQDYKKHLSDTLQPEIER